MREYEGKMRETGGKGESIQKMRVNGENCKSEGKWLIKEGIISGAVIKRKKYKNKEIFRNH